MVRTKLAQILNICNCPNRSIIQINDETGNIQFAIHYTGFTKTKEYTNTLENLEIFLKEQKQKLSQKLLFVHF